MWGYGDFDDLLVSFQIRICVNCYGNDDFIGSLQVMPYSTGCKTVLSNFEVQQNYKVCDF